MKKTEKTVFSVFTRRKKYDNMVKKTGTRPKTESSNMKLSISTLGCRVNQYESDAITEMAEAEGFEVVPFGIPCDIAVINTCSVTAESEKKSRKLIRRAAALSDGHVIVTGCSVGSSAEKIKKIPGVRAVLGNGAKDLVISSAKGIMSDNITTDDTDLSAAPMTDMTDLATTRAHRARAFIKIEDGCNGKCAYCIIPSVRGPVRSRSAKSILNEVKKVSATCPEIILTGIETAAFGTDRKEKDALAKLMRDVDRIPTVKRLTLGSLDPTALTDGFLENAASLESLLPHFHISVQSGCSSVLARMRRKYRADTILERMEAARKAIPGVSFSADVIVGFPGETEEEFLETVAFCKEARFMHLHIFPYSRRKGTFADTMADQVPEHVKSERLAKLAGLQADIKRQFMEELCNKYHDGGCLVLAEQKKNGYYIAHSPEFAEVRIDSDCDIVGTVCDVVLDSTDGEVCFGRLAYKVRPSKKRDI